MSFKKHNKFNIAFTLSEVLITLAIIGIVTEMTVPTLINNSNKAFYASSLAKAASTWSQALNQMSADGGCPGDLSCFFDRTGSQMVRKMLPYFKIVKFCSSADTVRGCFPDTIYTNFDGTGPSLGYDNWNTAITADGMSIKFYPPSKNCSQSVTATTGYTFQWCMDNLLIDVNGLKGPNALGRDVYWFAIMNNGTPELYLQGDKRDSFYWKTGYCNYGYEGGMSKAGWKCGGRVREEGWKMTY